MKTGKLNILMIGLILLFISAFSGVDKTFAQQQFIRGDADGDCLVGVLDIYFLVCWGYTPGAPPPPCGDAADVNDDGSMDATDIVCLMNYLFIPPYPPPPPPFPDPGFDPTPEGLDCANACVAPTPSNLDSLIAPSVSGSAGDTIAVPIIVRNSQDLLAYQLHLEFDPNILQVTEVLNTGVANPYEFGFDTLSPGVVNIWCYIDCQQSRSIPAGRHTLVKIMFQVNQSASCATTLLDLKTVTGPPFWGNLLDYAGGKVYPTLVDGNLTIERAAPCIISITDVGNDAGGQVRLNWARSCYDASGSPVTITEYSIWRRAETYESNMRDTEYLSSRDIKVVASTDEMLARVSEAKPGDRFLVVGDKGSSGIVWLLITYVLPMQFEQYAYDAPTECDSAVCAGICWSVFFVAAHTQDPTVHYNSDPDSGYSLDNTLKCGDVDGDGSLSAADVVYLINYLYEHGPSPKPMAAGDINCDGAINAADVVYLINYLYIHGPKPCGP